MDTLLPSPKKISKKNDPLMLSVSGIRGIWGTSLHPGNLTCFIASFAQYVFDSIQPLKKNPIVVIGRDSRISGDLINSIVETTLISMGVHVIPLGIAATPTVQYCVKTWPQADAGIIITASHNPKQWNGLKFVWSNGLFFGPDQCEAVYSRFFEKGESNPWQHFFWDQFLTGKILPVPETPNKLHINSLLSLSYIDPTITQKAKLKIALDTTNGAGGPIMTELLENLGCSVVPLYTKPTGVFGRSPEPIPEHLNDLCKAVVDNKCDLGIATDPDVDRCVFVNEKGQPLGEEYTLGIALDFYLSINPGNVVSNLSTSRLVDVIASKYNCISYRSKVGEINVAQEMIRVKAVIGGEGNGGVMLPDSHIGRDAPVSACLVIQHFCNLKLKSPTLTFSQLKALLPQYTISKLKCNVSNLSANPDEIISHFDKEYQKNVSVTLNRLDGLRIDHPDYWIHLRKSNTEPVIRVIGEANPNYIVDPSSSNQSESLCQNFMKTIENKFSK